MKIRRIIFLFLAVIILLLPEFSSPCTTFCFQHNGEWVYGRNYDWIIEHCLVIVNKRGVIKTALTEDNPAQWVSKYGSITFNQYGREFPLGGMNEAGLVLECMWLEHTEYPHPDSRSGLSDLQWVQYQLDNFATVDEVIASNDDVRISVRNSTPLHFLVCDRNGRVATIEFLAGKTVVHTKENLPVSVLTNNTYEYSVDLLKVYEGDETSEVFDAADYSLKRFVWAAQGVNSWDSEKNADPVDYAWEILDKVAVNVTMFRIVYDVKNGRIHFRTKSNPNLRFLNFNAFNFSCSEPVKILDISAGEGGDVTAKFSDYTYEANYDLICRSYAGTGFLKNVSDEVRQIVAKYPESLKCSE